MAYPPKPQPNQQQGQQDPLLSGLMSQPSQPSQPAQGGQTGDWGGGNNWWQGASKAGAPAGAPAGAGANQNAGYGDYAPNPNAGGAPPPPPPPPPPDPNAFGQGTPAGGTPPTQPKGPRPLPQSAVNMFNKFQSQLVGYQQDLAYAQSQGDQSGISNAQYRIHQMLKKINQFKGQWQGAGYDVSMF